MAWTYADWRAQTTEAGQLERLRLHMGEVSNEVSAAITAGSKSRDSSQLNDYLANLEENARRLERITGSGVVRPVVVHADLRGRG